MERQRLSAVLRGLGKDDTRVQIAAAVGTTARSVSSGLDADSRITLQAELDQTQRRRAEDARTWFEEKPGRKITWAVTYKY